MHDQETITPFQTWQEAAESLRHAADIMAHVLADPHATPQQQVNAVRQYADQTLRFDALLQNAENAA